MESIFSLAAVTGNAAKIDEKYVHKAERENVVISDIRRVDDSGNNVFECRLVFDHNLPFFFEHYIDHVPGLLLIEAARQMKTAVSHIYYGIGFDHSFILCSNGAVFKDFVELDSPVTLRLVMDESGISMDGRGRKIFYCKVFAIQDNVIKAELESRWRCVHKRIMNKMRSRKMSVV